jgi:manganese/zinc/iron transport system permease protein
MDSLFRPFDFHQVIIAPWTTGLSTYGWTMLMGFFVAVACGLVGNYLILRRMALVGDAISHSVLPGLVIAFLIAGKRDNTAMFVGALVAGVVTTMLIEVIHKKTRVKQDAAIGITFTSLFAIGVILVSQFASRVDLDQECVLYGEITHVSIDLPVVLGGINLGPASVVRMGVVMLLTILLIAVFYKELLVSSFDPGLASSLGINSTIVHYALMCWLSMVVVSAFEAVGSILVIAMLILPGATASLWTQRLFGMHVLAVVHSAVSAVLGLHLAIWLDCNPAAAMVVMGAVLFGFSWLFSPSQGLVRRWTRLRHESAESPSNPEPSFMGER